MKVHSSLLVFFSQFFLQRITLITICKLLPRRLYFWWCAFVCLLQNNSKSYGQILIKIFKKMSTMEEETDDLIWWDPDDHLEPRMLKDFLLLH